MEHCCRVSSTGTNCRCLSNGNKAAYNTTVLTSKLYFSSAGAEEVDCGVQQQKAWIQYIQIKQQLYTFIESATGATPMLVTVQSKLNTGDWATEVSTFEITVGNEISLDKQ